MTLDIDDEYDRQSLDFSDLVNFRSDIYLEPLVYGFYAWLQLISPPASAMHFVKSRIPLLESFLARPDLHRSSCQEPALRGSFVDLDSSASSQVTELLKVLNDSKLIELATSLDHLATALADQAVGFDLTPLYKAVPDQLRGLVELVYDLGDHARIRLVEGMWYRSRFYDESSQSLDISVATDDNRAFTMTTPRLQEPGHVQLSVPFSDKSIDVLCASESTAQQLGDLAELMGVDAEQQATFASFFETGTSPGPDRDYDGPGVRVRYFGHASVLLQTSQTAILSDPFLSARVATGRFTYRDIPDVLDCVVITHGHQDHMELGTLLRLRHKIRRILVPKTSSGALQDPSPRQCLEAMGFKNVVDVEAGDVVEVGDFRIVVCPFVGEQCDLDIGAKVTYALTADERTIYLAADSRGIDSALFSHMHEMVGVVDAAFIGMECDGAPLQWLYGALFPTKPDYRRSQSRRLNGSDANEALAMVDGLRPKSAYVYAMGREPWLQHVMATDYTEDSYQLKQQAEFIQGCHERGVPAGALIGQAEWTLS